MTLVGEWTAERETARTILQAQVASLLDSPGRAAELVASARACGAAGSEHRLELLEAANRGWADNPARQLRRIALLRQLHPALTAEALDVCVAADTALRAGDWRTARRWLAPWQELPDGEGFFPLLLDLEACLTALDRRDQPLGDAHRLLEQASQRVGRLDRLAAGSPERQAVASRVAGALAAERSAPEADALLARAEQLARQQDLPVTLIRTLLSRARFGDARSADRRLAWLREAESLAREVDAPLLAEQARRRIRSTHRAAHSGRHGVQSGGDDERALASLLGLGRAISSILELDPLLERILDEVLALVGADRGFVMLREPGGAGYRLQVARNIDQQQMSQAAISSKILEECLAAGEPLLIPDAMADDRFCHRESVILHEHHAVLCLPLVASGRPLGAVWVESHRPAGFTERDLELCLPFVAQAAVAITNARAFERIQELYEEARSLSAAREKILSHLSHELVTPVAIIGAGLAVARRHVGDQPKALASLQRARRNLERLRDIQLSIGRIYRSRLGPDPGVGLTRISPARLLAETIESTRQKAPGRRVRIALRADPSLQLEVAEEALRTVLDSLLKNAVENTPDGSRVVVGAHALGTQDLMFEIRDAGVGVTEQDQHHLFSGFFHTQQTADYSSRRPFEFDAGGKGLELLEVLGLSRRHGWTLSFDSERCPFLTGEERCPGDAADCPHLAAPAQCLDSGGTLVRLRIPRGDGPARPR